MDMTVIKKDHARHRLLCRFMHSGIGAFAQSPTTREYPYIYKSTRAMGMGARTAVGGRVTRCFIIPPD
jgi:hypothetical protein